MNTVNKSLCCTVTIFFSIAVGMLSGCGRTENTGIPESSLPRSAQGSSSNLRKNVHPSFALTDEDIEALTANIPKRFSEKIRSGSRAFLDRFISVLDDESDLVLLVDKTHALPETYAPQDLVDLKEPVFTVNKAGMKLRKIAADPLRLMLNAASREGFNIPVISAYRTYQYQAGLYARNVAENGQETADRESAQPGKSQHQLGTTVDLGSLDQAFGSTGAGLWLSENAWKYGFSLSYPEGLADLTGYKYEPWHYRFIGPSAAYLEREYFGGIQHYFLQFVHDAIGKIRSARIES